MVKKLEPLRNMDIERVVTVYDKISDILLQEYPLNNIDLQALRLFFRLPEQDYLMYDTYKINKKEASLMSKFVPNILFDFQSYDYYVECFQK